MDILLVDDEPLARSRLKRLISDIPDYYVVGEAANAEMALALIYEKDPDIIFIDVQMPGENGLSLAKTIGKLDNPPAMIFCSAYERYALDAFGTLAVGYLVKPVRPDDLQDALRKVSLTNRLQRQHIQTQTSSSIIPAAAFISTKTRLGVTRIPLDSIFYFIADQKYVTVVHTDGESLIDQSLKELEILFSDHVIRSHRNTLINKRHLKGLEKSGNGQFVLSLLNSEHKPQVSRRHLSDVREWLMKVEAQ